MFVLKNRHKKGKRYVYLEILHGSVVSEHRNFLTACLFLQNELFHEGNAMLVKVKLEPEAPCRK